MTKITKTQARKKLEKGEAVYMLPSKVAPGSIWIHPCRMANDGPFEEQENAYSYYNCNTETGKRVTFWAA